MTKPLPGTENYHLWPARGDRRRARLGWWHRKVLFWPVAALCILTFLLSGCATFDYGWKQTKPASVKPWFYVYVDDADMACRLAGSTASATARIHGCSVWRPIGCEIYLPKQPPQWLIQHEEKHCEGYVHD